MSPRLLACQRIKGECPYRHGGFVIHAPNGVSVYDEKMSRVMIRDVILDRAGCLHRDLLEWTLGWIQKEKR